MILVDQSSKRIWWYSKVEAEDTYNDALALLDRASEANDEAIWAAITYTDE